MNLETDGVCIYCKRDTPVSANTKRPEGIVCASCRRSRGSWEEVRRAQVERLSVIEEERERLLRSLSTHTGLN